MHRRWRWPSLGACAGADPLSPITIDPVATAPDPLQWWSGVAAESARTRRSVSLELRWFGTGDPPAVLDTLAATGTAQFRTDRYAIVDRDDLSLKRRGRSRLGLKQRRCRVPVVDDLPPAERWTRRTSRRASIAQVEHQYRWLAVAKHRVRLLVDLSGVEPEHCGDRRSTLVRGGSLEVVHLEVLGEGGTVPLWSVAAEAWGAQDRVGLRQLLHWSPVDWRAVDRQAVLRGGYPALLRRVAGIASSPDGP